MNHWIIAPVILPAVLAALAVLLARDNQRAARAISGLGAVALVVLAAELLRAASLAPPEVYFLGDWPAPFGIVLVLDRVAALMLMLTAGLGLVVLVQAVATGADRKGRHFHALFLFQMMGLNGAFLTGDLFNLFVFFEVLLIASYGLMVHGGGGARLRAGVQYIAVNLVGSTLFLVALATIYSVTGTLNMADLAEKLPRLPEADWALIRLAAVLLMLVFAIKGALVPLQFWLPGTYARAPGVVAALFAVMTKVGAYAMLRTGMLIFPPALPATGTLVQDMLMPAALVTLVLGSAGVLGAASLPRQAAFAAIASMGTVFLAISGYSAASSTAALYYMLHSTLATALIFLVADLAVARAAGTARLPASLAVLYLAAAIALAGLPPLSGFIGKLYVLQAWQGHAGLVWSVVLIASFLSVLGFSRAGSALFWKPDGPPALPVPAVQLLAPGLLLAGMVGLTMLAGPLDLWLQGTAAGLTDPAPYVAANRLVGGG